MDGNSSPGSPIILRSHTMSRDQEYFKVADKYKTGGEADWGFLAQKLRRVRRRPGVEQLGSQDDGPAASIPRMLGHARKNTASNLWDHSGTSDATSLLQSIQQLDSAAEERHRQDLEMRRALWESTLPKPLADHIGYFSTGHGLDHIHSDQTA